MFVLIPDPDTEHYGELPDPDPEGGDGLLGLTLLLLWVRRETVPQPKIKNRETISHLILFFGVIFFPSFVRLLLEKLYFILSLDPDPEGPDPHI